MLKLAFICWQSAWYRYAKRRIAQMINEEENDEIRRSRWEKKGRAKDVVFCSFHSKNDQNGMKWMKWMKYTKCQRETEKRSARQFFNGQLLSRGWLVAANNGNPLRVSSLIDGCTIRSPSAFYLAHPLAWCFWARSTPPRRVPSFCQRCHCLAKIFRLPLSTQT